LLEPGSLEDTGGITLRPNQPISDRSHPDLKHDPREKVPKVQTRDPDQKRLPRRI